MRRATDSHQSYRELLAARLDRQLTRAESRSLTTHLKSCPACQQADREYREQRQMLRALPPPPVPRDLWARTSAALDREVTRPYFRYRFLRRRLGPARVDATLRDVRGNRGGTPSALATVVAAVGVVLALAVVQLVPGLRLTPPDAARPTPIAVMPQSLAVVAAGGPTELSVLQTSVDRVCPSTAPDCYGEAQFNSQVIIFETDVEPRSVALSPDGENLAMVGHGQQQDVIAVVVLSRSEGGSVRPTPEPQRSARVTPAANESPSEPTGPTGSDQPTGEPSPDVQPSGSATPADTSNPQPPATDPPPLPTEPAIEPTSPPASAVAGLEVLSILEGVHSAGAPPAWSRDSTLLAFSAMPADGSHGPDVYVWQPDDEQARAITSDHASYFASWSGSRVVVSRVEEPADKDAPEATTVVIDPETLEERQVGGPRLWLPTVDPSRDLAVAWRGSLESAGSVVTAGEGVLWIVDWSALDPFGANVTPDVDDRDVSLWPLDAEREAATNPVVDWQVDWSDDGRVLGFWETETRGSTWGELILLAVDSETGVASVDQPFLGPSVAQRGFSLGLDRVAWVAAADEGDVLRVRTWGSDGAGDLRIDAPDVQEIAPAF